MQGYFALATFVLLIIMVLSRVFLMRKLGIKALRFGEKDKKDFLIIPFALLFFYLILSSAFKLPRIGAIPFNNQLIGWIGVAFCMLGLMLFLYSLISFGKSFRVGLDEEKPGALITSGAFALSRNPIYTAFGFVLFGFCLIFPNWILWLYLFAGIWLFHRHVLLEEASMKKIYGGEYAKYCKKVRRYL